MFETAIEATGIDCYKHFVDVWLLVLRLKEGNCQDCDLLVSKAPEKKCGIGLKACANSKDTGRKLQRGLKK